MPNSPFFLPSNNYPGSSGYSTGSESPSIYGYGYDPIRKIFISGNPNSPGLDMFGRMKPVLPNASVTGPGGVNPYASLLGGNSSPTAVPGIGVPPGTVTAPPMGPAAATPGGGYNPTSSPGAGFNPFFTVANTKSPEISSQISDILGKFNDLKSLDPTSGVTDAMKAQDPNYQKYLTEETGAVGKYYSGDVQAALDNLRALRKSAYATATDRAMATLSKQLASQQLTGGGAGTLGNSSYLQKQGLDTSAGLMAQEGLDNATQARADYGTVLQGQQANLGTRANLTTADIQRMTLPSQVGANWFNTLLQSLGPIAALQLQNTFYGLGGGRNGVSVPYTGGPVGGGGAPNSRPIPMPNPNQPNPTARPTTPGANPSFMPVPQWLRDQWNASNGPTAPSTPSYMPVPPWLQDQWNPGLPADMSPQNWPTNPTPNYDVPSPLFPYDQYTGSNQTLIA